MSIVSVTEVRPQVTEVIVKCDFHNGEGDTERLEVPTLGFYNWFVRGVHIQKAMPELTPEQREKLISGMCDACDAKIFGTEE